MAESHRAFVNHKVCSTVDNRHPFLSNQCDPVEISTCLVTNPPIMSCFPGPTYSSLLPS